MSDAVNALENATIKADGMVREAGPNGEPVQVYIVEMPDRSFWFETYYKYVENSNDHWVTIWNFGLHRRTAAGSKTPLVRDEFTAAEAATARRRLETLFLGPQDNPALLWHPPKTRCLGVNFPDGWITVV